MFDKNEFKRKVKEWMKVNPQGCEQELLDFCEELIPPNQFASNQWLVDQTMCWYKYLLDHRNKCKIMVEEQSDSC